MKCIEYDEKYTDYEFLKSKIKLIYEFDDYENLTNEEIKISSRFNAGVIKKIIGIEMIPIKNYNLTLDLLATGGYYTSDNIIDKKRLQKDFKLRNDNLVILTLGTE